MSKVTTAALAALLFSGAIAFVAGCETAHSEKDKTTILGGQKHEETTTYKNPVTGDTSVEHKESKSGGL